MTSVITQSRELPQFFPFWPHKWRNAFSEYSMRAENSAQLWTQTEKAEAKGHAFCFTAEEFLVDEKDCHKILTFLTYFLIDFCGSAKHILNWLASET